MRFALPAVATISGLGLLTASIYGQPALYLQRVHQEWTALIAGSDEDQPAEPDANAITEQMAQLQQQVARLQTELAARQALDPQVAPAVAIPTVPVPAPQVQASPVPAPPVQVSPVEVPPVEVPAVEVPPGQDGPVSATGSAGEGVPAPVPALPPSVVADLKLLHVPAMTPPAAPPVIAPPERHETRVEPHPSIVARTEPAKPEAPEREASGTNAPKPVVQKPSPVKPLPVAQPPQIRPDIDDTKSVLARLRQQPPAATPSPAPQPDASRLPEPPPRPNPSPFVPRLTAARAALTSGRVEEARRLLQEAQLQRVFRPAEVAGEDSASAARGAADVARALEALSGNDAALSRRYIDVAVGDLSGNATEMPVQRADTRISGYAPAYPSR